MFAAQNKQAYINILRKKHSCVGILTTLQDFSCQGKIQDERYGKRFVSELHVFIHQQQVYATNYKYNLFATIIRFRNLKFANSQQAAN